uniref:RING-type domain-containing protein n=1 Tax=Globodera rostochiensis TaxID=31243 RepID=A0A914HL54_GLORO
MPSDYLPLKRNYKFTILPLNHNNLDSIINEHSFSKDLVQEFYDLNMNDPVDTICQFCEKRCFINYFESLQKRETVLNDLIDNWLSRIGNYEEFLNKENFFLLANFRDLIDKAKQHEIAATKMPNQRIAELIDEFCEIDVDFLKWHTKVSAEISKSNLPEKFCSFWPATKEKATKLLHKEMALNAFSQWLNTSEQLNNEEEQIIQFWIDVFAKRLASCNFKWPELDNDLFVEIGMLFANVREQECLTLDKIERVKGTRKNLDTICKKIDQINRYQFNVPDSWNVELCANSKFQHVITHIITNRGEKRRLSDIIGSNSTKCVMCMEKERETAFDPCGHLFTCNKCSKNLTKCPICDMKIEAKLTIYKP